MLKKLALVILSSASLIEYASSSSESKLFRALRIDQASWTPTVRPLNSEKLGTNAQCSQACQSHTYQDGTKCQAYRIDPEGHCQFGLVIMEQCLPLSGKKNKAANMIKVYSNMQDTYKKGKAYELHTLREESGSNSSAVSAINDFGCPSLSWIPKGVINGGHSEIIRHKEGWMACGGNSSAQRKCRYWEPGMSEWIINVEDTLKTFNYGSCSAALSYDEAIIIGRDEFGPVGHHERVGLLESNGTWKEVSWYPVKVGYCQAFAMNSNFVYGFGGAGDGFDRTFKYDRAADEWTEVGEMRFGTSNPSCVRTSFRGRDSILCFGGKDLFQGQSQIFDFETEDWKDLHPILAPREPRVSAHMFVQGNQIYRPYMDKLHIFDMIEESWSEETDITAPDVAYDQLEESDMIVLTVDVIYRV